MSIPHTVKVGDSLWSIAHRYLGCGTRWPVVRDHHNQQAALKGARRLLVIEDPNLIYIGQTIMVPLRTSQTTQETGLRQEANQAAKGVDLKIVYKIEGPDKQYRRETPDYTIEAKLSGTITIENVMHDSYEHNFELSLGRSDVEIKHKLGQYADHAFRDLTQGVSLDYADGKVTLQAPLMYQAGLGPYTIEVAAESPTTLKGTLKPDPFSTIATVGRRRYKHSTDIRFDITVTLHPARKINNPKTVREAEPRKIQQRASEQISELSPTQKTTAKYFVVSVMLIILGYIAWQTRMMPSMEGTTTIGPFSHTIPMDQQGMI